MTKQITPFDRMKMYLEKAGFELEPYSDSDGNAFGYITKTHDNPFRDSDDYEKYSKYEHDNEEMFKCGVDIAFGWPSGEEWYWKLDGKIAVDNQLSFDKWSRVPFCAWLPETDEEAEKIMEVIKFIGSPKGYDISNNFGRIEEMFGFEVLNRDSVKGE